MTFNLWNTFFGDFVVYRVFMSFEKCIKSLVSTLMPIYIFEDLEKCKGGKLYPAFCVGEMIYSSALAQEIWLDLMAINEREGRWPVCHAGASTLLIRLLNSLTEKLMKRPFWCPTEQDVPFKTKASICNLSSISASQGHNSTFPTHGGSPLC